MRPVQTDNTNIILTAEDCGDLPATIMQCPGGQQEIETCWELDPAELAACTADVRRSYDYAKWMQLTSKVEHSHSQNYAAYSH